MPVSFRNALRVHPRLTPRTVDLVHSAARHFTTSFVARGGGRPDRGNFKALTSADVDAFKSFAKSPSSILSTIPYKDGETLSSEDLVTYNKDWMNKYSGSTPLVLRPKSAEEVSQIVAYCVKNRIALVPQGGNTGLVGGSVPVHDEVVLNLASMDKIRNFDEVSGILSTDAGCVLQALDDHILEKGYMMPLDLGAKGSCHIGGNLATNAGGLRLLRYGSLHGSVLGIEAVIADEKGTILRVGMHGLRKDNTGLDLKQLFIGSEGYLGIITGATILTTKKPNARNITVLALPDFEAVQNVFQATRNHLNEILSAFEFWDQAAFENTLHHTGLKIPFENPDSYKQGNNFYVLIETHGSNSQHDQEKMESLLTYVMENDMILDGVLAQDETQLQNLWAMRESIPESAGKTGSVYKYDVSLPPPQMYSLVEAARQRFKEVGMMDDGTIITAMGYGHFGDSNLHLNVVAKKYDPAIEEVLEPWIYEWISERNGSISAEHGLGLMKAEHAHYSQTPEAIEYMRKIKPIFDKEGILNPGKYLRY